jgi:hypothetical protein
MILDKRHKIERLDLSREKWLLYEIAKAKIEREAQSAEEYEQSIARLCAEMGV